MASCAPQGRLTWSKPIGCPIAGENAPSRALVVRAAVPSPGRYGGAPLDRRIRRGWGGGPVKDPLESGDYLWDNKEEWQRVIDHELQQASEQAKPRAQPEQSPEEARGFLSISRSLALDRVDMDLSRELAVGTTVSLEDQVAQARRLSSPQGREDLQRREAGEDSIRWKAINTPTARQGRKWERSSSNAGSYSAPMQAPLSPEEQERRFQELKNSLLLYTFGLGACFSATAAVAYSPEVAASFAVGSVGSLIYARMLTTSVESLGSSDMASAARGSLGQPRLLVPVLLVMAYNRWNAILVPEYGVVELQLLPVLLGFFTYKAATIVRTFQDILLPEDAPQAPPPQSG